LDAAARYVFLLNDAKFEGYPSITATGTNAWHGHYFRNSSQLKEGELVLMDYAPDYHYYTSDVTRMWPVSGKYSADQRTLCGFILAYRNALIKRIRPGVTADQVLDGAAGEMESVWKATHFSKEIYRKAAGEALTFRGHLSHPVGMTVHDVGNYRSAKLVAGLVFSIDPMIWIPEEKLYVRMEDVIAVTENGVENFTDFLPDRPDDIEKLMREEGILKLRLPVAH
jgi:Xaa-Pro aminopeptidase